MELPDNPSSDYLSYINHEKEQLLIESTSCLNNMRDYLERNVFCNAIGGNFQDIIESLTPENMLNFSTCEVSAKRVMKMLKELVNHVSQNNLTIQELIDFTDYVLTLTTTQGIILPFCSSNEPRDLSLLSIDSSLENYSNFPDINGSITEKTECENLWKIFGEKMTKKARMFLSDFGNPNSLEENENFGKLVEILLLFNSTIASWKIYKEVRQLALESVIKEKYKSINQLNNLGLTLTNWLDLSDIIIQSLSVDCRFISVLFIEVTNAQEAILNFYLDFTIDEVRTFLDELIKKKISTLNDNDKSSKSIGKSTKKVNVKIKVSEEIDDNDVSKTFSPALNGSSSDLKSQISPFLLNLDNFQNLSNIIACFARMENRIDSLLNNQWSTPLGVNINSNLNAAKKPKGVLKKIRRPSRLLSNEVSEYRIPERSSPGTDNVSSPVFEQESPTYIPCIEWQTMVKPIFPSFCVAFEYHLMTKFELITFGKDLTSFFIEPLNQPAPVRASKSLQDYLQFLEDCLSLILVCHDPPVDELMSTFNRCIKNQISRIYIDLQQLVATRLSLDESIFVLSDSIALQMTWSLLNNLFKPKSDEIGVYFFEKKKVFSDFQKLLSRQIVDRCYNELVSSVLQDSKSNFWVDTKEFHENLRVGYPIQAWHLYLQRLWHLLGTNSPQQLAREILAEVLSRSLEFLVQRYAAAKPSARRLPQVRADMLAIFHIVEHYIYKISDNVDDLFGFGEDLSKLKKIHFASMALLQIILVLTGPIKLISNHFGNGFSKGMSKVKKSYSNSFWINLIKPNKYDCYLSNSEGMKPISLKLSSFVVLELFLETKQFETTKVIEVLCHNNMAMVSIILHHLYHQSLENSGSYEKIKEIFVLFYRSITRITDPFNQFHSVVIEIINRNNDWSHFNHKDGRSGIPVWLAALHELLMPYTESVVKLILERTCSSRRNKLDLNAQLFADGLLPCGCELEDNRLLDEKEQNKVYLKEVTEKICRQSLHLPISVQSLLAKLQEQLEEQNIPMLANHIVFSCLLETIKIGLCHNQLEDYETVWQTIVKYLEENECIYSNKDMVYNIYNKKLDDLDLNPFQEIEENRSAKSFFLGMQYNHITSKSEGLSDLKQINKFLRLNGELLKEMLESGYDSEYSLEIDLNKSLPPQNYEFEPIKSFCKIGNEEFDHIKYYKMVLDWSDLIITDIGLSEISFETILSNRWELEYVQNENAEPGGIDDEDREAVVKLIDKFGLSLKCNHSVDAQE